MRSRARRRASRANRSVSGERGEEGEEKRFSVHGVRGGVVSGDVVVAADGVENFWAQAGSSISVFGGEMGLQCWVQHASLSYQTLLPCCSFIFFAKQ